jgi:hypothetical protein
LWSWHLLGGDGFSGHVSILGIVLTTGNLTEFGDANNEEIGAASFFARVGNGALIVFKDDDSDGLAEAVEVED